MISSYYTATAGIKAAQSGFEVSANNLANASTTGYKTVEATFSDLMYTNIHAPEGEASDLQKGTGAKLANTDTVYKVGNMQQTDRSLDFAITQTNGYFAVQTGAEIKYTRNGNFKLSAENGVNYLTTAEGGYILDAGGQRITVASEEDDIDIGVYSFTNENGLTREGETYYVANNTSGEATAITNAAIKTGFLEGSSVNIADEMTAVIQLQRAFQMNSKIVQISDELMQTVNSLR